MMLLKLVNAYIGGGSKVHMFHPPSHYTLCGIGGDSRVTKDIVTCKSCLAEEKRRALAEVLRLKDEGARAGKLALG